MRVFILLFILFSTLVHSQTKLSGEWQGIIIEKNQDWKEGKPIYMTISVINGLIDGKIREEIYNSSNFSILKISGKTTSSGSIELSEDRVLKQTEKFYDNLLWNNNEQKLSNQKKELELYASKTSEIFNKFQHFYNSSWTTDIPFIVTLYPIPGKRGNSTATPAVSIGTLGRCRW